MSKIVLIISTIFLIFLVLIYFFPLNLKKSAGICTQVTVIACHDITGECRVFGNSCDLPNFWNIKK